MTEPLTAERVIDVKLAWWVSYDPEAQVELLCDSHELLRAQVAAAEQRIATLEAAPISDAPPCGMCGGVYQFDTSVASPVWNQVVREHGHPEYLCLNCIVQVFARAERSFEAQLWGGPFDGLGLAVTFTEHPEQNAAGLLEGENNELRVELRQAEAALTEATAKIATLAQDRDEWKALASVGPWHNDCRPNRQKAAQEIAKSQQRIDALAAQVVEREQRIATLDADVAAKDRIIWAGRMGYAEFKKEHEIQAAALTEATAYLVRLVTTLTPQCASDGSLLTLCTQIDNYIAGQAAALTEARAELAKRDGFDWPGWVRFVLGDTPTPEGLTDAQLRRHVARTYDAEIARGVERGRQQILAAIRQLPNPWRPHWIDDGGYWRWVCDWCGGGRRVSDATARPDHRDNGCLWALAAVPDRTQEEPTAR